MRLKDLILLGLSIVTLFLATHTDCANAATNRYPSVRATQKTFDVPDIQKMNVLLLIRSKVGKPLYRLRCAHPGYDGDYSGDFECRLDTTGSDDADVENTLLVEDVRQVKQWPTRGRFFAADLTGKCAAIPEFGATRDFRLRGMKLTLQVLDPVIDRSQESWVGAGDPTLKSMTLKVTVHPDPSATRSIAAIVPFPSNPPPQCGIHPGAWPVGSLGDTRGLPFRDISYFGDPATFTKGNPLPAVDWSAVPFAKPGEWNRGMRTGGTPNHCDAQFHKDATFRGKLIAQKFYTNYVPEGAKSKPVLDGTVLKLTHPINICPQAASRAATRYAEAVSNLYKEHHARAPATVIAEARQSVIQEEGVFTRHVTALEADAFNLIQLNAYNQKYIGHSVEISGSIDSDYRRSTLAQYDLPELNVDSICLLLKGKPTACSSDMRPL